MLKNGDHIKITWLSSCRNAPGHRNPYIGMSGTVTGLNSKEGYFHLFTGNSWLCAIKTGFFNLRYKRLKGPGPVVPIEA